MHSFKIVYFDFTLQILYIYKQICIEKYIFDDKELLQPIKRKTVKQLGFKRIPLAHVQSHMVQ